MEKLGEDGSASEAKCKHLNCQVAGNVHWDENGVNLRDPEAILLIKQLQEKVDFFFFYSQLKRLFK